MSNHKTREEHERNRLAHIHGQEREEFDIRDHINFGHNTRTTCDFIPYVPVEFIGEVDAFILGVCDYKFNTKSNGFDPRLVYRLNVDGWPVEPDKSN